MPTKQKEKIKPTLLIILDGWGLALPSEGNAITKAKIPNYEFYFGSYPHTNLTAHGEAVGLPRGYMGNSEVGHLTLGSGRTVDQDLVRINRAIKDGTFYQNPTLLATIFNIKYNNSKLHLMGLISKGGVHGEIEHLYALLEFAKRYKIKEVCIHLFTDGRDMPPKSADEMIHELEAKIKKFGVGKIVSITGRYYAMDRAHNWNRSQDVYEAMVYGKGEQAKTAHEAIDRAYKKGLNDQTIPPTLIGISKKEIDKNLVKDKDAIIFINFRSDRARQLTKPFVMDEFKFFDRGNKHPSNLFFVGMTDFGVDLPMFVAYPMVSAKNALPEVLGNHMENKQCYIAEEEKFAHVAFFFHGGSSIPEENEERIMIDTPDVADYAKLPEMALPQVTAKLVEMINKNEYEFIMTNISNADMIAHTGNLPASIKAVECIDKYLKIMIDEVLKLKGRIIVTADHGNAEELIDLETGGIDTKHSTNPVPFIIISEEEKIVGRRAKNKLKLRDGELADVAPTILDLLGIEKPKEMSGHSLLEE
ncbi:MAG: 2,3-bisphosphoglycerate-independent phosphoglycerate mutase [bacterium]